ncbi:ATP-binding protein [Dyadobacter subterraneus]|uniref:histidine kinase n=1 Tax=Dyadobacter subterraneus TaxID=2773304 RepID=A0ABR9WE26_9BACT|nr:ATP-binding protein [Dyadobacter subterraneus]MBE9462606.1 GAF domain-containing protein [Dyadobacter subterraneus]
MYSDNSLSRDIENVRQIPIVSTMLEVVCRTTGMGFAAIARVTQDRWIACTVRDEISFGLEPGGELPIETTICNEIRDAQQAVIINDVAVDPTYVNHHTPRIYGFKSYISVPIFLKNGDFFGTLCAIDPNPADLNNAKTIGMFKLFTDLISFHLHSIEVIEKSNETILDMNRQLTESRDENRQYQHISSHNLQEPLRKIRMFSSMLIDAAEAKDTEKAKYLSLKINASAQKFSMMIKDLSDFSELKDTSFEPVDLNKIISDVCVQLKSELEEKSVEISVTQIPVIQAVPFQMEQLFYHLIHNSIKFAKKDDTPIIDIQAKVLSREEILKVIPTARGIEFMEILMEDNGIGIEKSQLENIFDMFSQLPYDKTQKGRGIGLSYCRKIIRNHNGIITAQSESGKGTRLRIILPMSRN